jgi:hypothetical protein
MSVTIIRNQFGRLAGVVGDRDEIDAYMSEHRAEAEEVAAAIFSDDVALTAFELGEANDYPAPVSDAIGRLIARRDREDPSLTPWPSVIDGPFL